MRQLTIADAAVDEVIAKCAHQLLDGRAETHSRALAGSLVAKYLELGDVLLKP